MQDLVNQEKRTWKILEIDRLTVNEYWSMKGEIEKCYKNVFCWAIIQPYFIIEVLQRVKTLAIC